MSVHDQAATVVLSQLVLAADGALLGLVLAYVPVRSILKFTAHSSARHRIEQAPSVRVSDLRSVISSSDGDDRKLVIASGSVEAKSAINGDNWKGLRSGASGFLVSRESGDKCVILRKDQMV